MKKSCRTKERIEDPGNSEEKHTFRNYLPQNPEENLAKFFDILKMIQEDLTSVDHERKPDVKKSRN